MGYFVLFIGAFFGYCSADNPFEYAAMEVLSDDQKNSYEPRCVAEGFCGDQALIVMKTDDGSLHVMKEKVPSTLGKAEGLGG
jgi:hypothetical protein